MLYARVQRLYRKRPIRDIGQAEFARALLIYQFSQRGFQWSSNVALLRKAAELSQAQLAVTMGVDRAYISGLERGERNATIVSLWHVSQALGVKIGALFEEEK
jgi:DNA-binding XRE family transcriptional regulator